MTFKHQGDVSFVPVEKVDGEKVKHDGRITLALGETTGHSHQLAVLDHNDLEAWRTIDGTFYITLKTEGQVTHEEHGTITLSPGTYRVGQEREMGWFALTERAVID